MLLAAAVATAVAAVLVLGSSPAPPGEEPPPESFRLLQMNLCLSGIAGCFPATDYPAVVDEAVSRITEASPTAVTLNEVCEQDVARIARKTGYRLRFVPVPVFDEPFPCTDPGGRGVFGLAVLTAGVVREVESRDFSTRSFIETRGWLCVTTDPATVCTAHLAPPVSPADRRDNARECGELRAMLDRRAAAGPVVFAGDVNRSQPCVPDSMWSADDAAASQSPGVQHVYGSRSLGTPEVMTIASERTDHDVLVVDVVPAT